MSDPAIPLTTADLPAEGAAELDAILDNSHPLMVEAFYLASIPHWYDRRLLERMRNRDDGREEGLIIRLNRYSFVSALRERVADEPAYFVRSEERSILQKRCIAEDPQVYRAAHQRALDFWEANPDPDPFAQAQNRLYHQFFVDFDASVGDLIDLFRTYANDRQLAAIDRLLTAAEEACAYVTLLDGGAVAGVDDLLIYLRARVVQLRGQWAESLELLKELGPSPDPRLSPYVARASGYALAQEGDYVAAIQRFKDALELFGQQEDSFIDPQSAQNDRAYTLIALGDAYVDLATDVRGSVGREALGSDLQHRLQGFFYFATSLPLVLYLSLYLGRRVWHPRFWPVLRDLDWIIARLFVTGASYYHKADRILDTYGAPAETVVADEKLAFLYLTWGDAHRAELLFWRLLAKAEGPLGTYHQASVRLGLGEAYYQLQRPKQAEEQLRAALPVLAMYEDREMEAQARELLAQALLATGEETEAIQYFAESCRWYQAEGRWTEATRIVERLETWVQPASLAQAVQTQITAVINSLQQRQYAGSFQHPVPTRFRRLVLTLLPAVLILAQLLAIRVETGSGLAPEIRFRPAPLLDPAQTVTPELSLGVTAARVDVLENASVLLWWAALLILGYFVLSLVLGLAAIAFTRPRSVQARGRGATVCLGLWTRPARDSSAFGLGAPQDQLVIGGSTSRYTSLRERVGSLVSPAARLVDLDCTVLRSRLGALFVLCLVLIGILDLLAKFAAPQLIFWDVLGTRYSVVDLYPYFFLWLVVAPLWWGVVQPLRQRLHLWPRSRLVPWMLGMGLLLALVQVVIHFRPLLTVVNLYPPLITLVVLVSAGIVVWRAEIAGQKVYPAYMRAGTAVVVTLACLLMMSVLWRDIRAYDYLVRGNSLRDRALQTDDADLSDALLAAAVKDYGRAVDIGSSAVWGIDTKAATGIPLGIPAPRSFTWLSALTSQAALRTQLGRYTEAIQSYTDALEHTDQQDRVYAWLALVRQSLATEPAEQGGITTDRNQYKDAIHDLEEAIRLNPNDASYYLWRGVALHALGRLDEALRSYKDALGCDVPGDGCLTDNQRERALTGQGWIMYTRENYKQALDLFWQAKEANPESAEAWLGEGYTLYSLNLFEEALPVWETAARLDPKDPTILISLGTLHWKFGGKVGQELGRDSCEEYRNSVDLFTQAVDRHRLWPQLDKDVAYTYRTRGQVQYLLGNCPGYDRAEMLKEAVDSYSEAVRLYPENAFYWHMRGRLSYVVWYILHDLSEGTDPSALDWLLRGLDDIERALELDPFDDETMDYRPNWFKQEYFMLATFKLGLTALQEEDIAKAVEFYSKELDSEADTVDTAVKLALIAVARDDIPEAAQWFNEAIRRTSIDRSQYTSRLKASRDHLRALWAISGVNSDDILAEMEAQLPGQLEAHPELQEEGYHWRYRAWFKYHLGLSAFRLGAEAAANALLQSAQADASRAYDISTDHADVYTYLPESAWGWYHVERGDDYVLQENLSAALADYEAAFKLIVPDDNSIAPAEKTDAAFSAGLTALKLGRLRRGATWYAEGIASVEEYGNNDKVKDEAQSAVEALQALLEENRALAPVAEPILDEFEKLR